MICESLCGGFWLRFMTKSKDAVERPANQIKAKNRTLGKM